MEPHGVPLRLALAIPVHAEPRHSVFDVVRDFLHEEALGDDDATLARYLRPDLLIIDDMGMKQLPKRSGEYLFEIIMRRHQTRSTKIGRAHV